ncbi:MULTISPECIES: hypothetical protein [Mesorhizobium]|nr:MULTISPECIES: hypothetical protein [Mesorhizobium]
MRDDFDNGIADLKQVTFHHQWLSWFATDPGFLPGRPAEVWS